MEDDRDLPLFETQKWRCWFVYRTFAGTMFVGICMIWIYRVTHWPDEDDRRGWAWAGLFAAELWFGVYWILTQSLRWNPVSRRTFKNRLAERYGEDLPAVDIFVCTADPVLEPPLMVVSTVLSVMAYDYPPEKIGVYLSDDAGSEITFFSLLEASNFSKHWIPYCKKYSIEPRAPSVYFDSLSGSVSPNESYGSISELYNEMASRIKAVSELGRVPEDLKSADHDFSQWNPSSTKKDHGPMTRILIDGSNPNSIDASGFRLPTLVYVAREKRADKPHNFKAGAMNAMIRVSSMVSNGSIILNVDCDMYSGNAQSIRDALCFFLDEKSGSEIAFVQFSQQYVNVTRHDLYGGLLRTIKEVEFHGLDGVGGPLYTGSGCFHRRESLCGMKFGEKGGRLFDTDRNLKIESARVTLNDLVSCDYEENSSWGKQTGLKYGCPVEDVLTGLSIQCQGWRSVYFNSKAGFMGLAPTTLTGMLVQHRRWSEGDFLILFSDYSPVSYGYGNLSPLLQMGYCTYCLWSPSCFAVLYYSLVPSLHLLRGDSLFPEVSSRWILPFVYVILGRYACSFGEFYCWSGGTVIGWWNNERMWLYKRTSSYLFAFVDAVRKMAGLSESGFVISPKVSDDEEYDRYERGVVDFGTASPMFIVLSVLALVNLFCFFAALVVNVVRSGAGFSATLQFLLCLALVLVNVPLYQAVFIRKDGGRMPTSVSATSAAIAIVACAAFIL